MRPGSQAETDYALEGGVWISGFDTEEDEAAAVVDIIKKLLALKINDEIEGEISLSNMVIIGRNRFVFGKLESCLKENSIPFSLRKGERQLEPSTRFGKVLDYAIRVKLNSKDWVDGKKLCQVLNISEPENWTANVLKEMEAQISSSNDEYSDIFANLLSAVDLLDVENPKIPKFVKIF
ncbi:hypothetical protein [Cedecea lapagei]|uniref:hypothetical protein n=1 Tax=Cedecea lapagei TaxID=158823 RepID=UPI001E5BDA99|nr:hypothetical protein [Cedecea lapagei]